MQHLHKSLQWARPMGLMSCLAKRFFFFFFQDTQDTVMCLHVLKGVSDPWLLDIACRSTGAVRKRRCWNCLVHLFRYLRLLLCKTLPRELLGLQFDKLLTPTHHNRYSTPALSTLLHLLYWMLIVQHFPSSLSLAAKCSLTLQGVH